MKNRKMLVIIIVSVCSTFYLYGTTGAEINYDVIHEDPKDDIKAIDENGNSEIVSGHEEIDIVKISSSKTMVKQNIILAMTVAGTIISSNYFSYGFSIMDGENEIYMVWYLNGTCSGINMKDYNSEPDKLVATWADTDTLEVTVPIKNIGPVTNFDLVGSGMENSEDPERFEIYMDQAPDEEYPWPGPGNGWEERTVTITEPTDGATVFKSTTIKGIVNTYEVNIQSVEVQIDTTSYSGWLTTSTSDDWSTWSYQWDTTKVSDGKHAIYVRVFDGEEYYFDSITVYVDQKTAVSPKSYDIPTFQIDDIFVYNMKYNTERLGMPEGATMVGSMTWKVVSIETININGKKYDVYVFDINSFQEVSYGLSSSKFTIDGTIWMQMSNLAIVKEDMKEESSDPIMGEYYCHEIITYDPPLYRCNFPIEVAEKWVCITNKTTENTETSEGETETYNYTTQTINSFECLRSETVTVLAGTFEVFLVRWDEEDKDEWYYDDSDGDGWTDDEEAHYGTDLDDPKDYPLLYPSDENSTAGEDGDSGIIVYDESSEEEMESENSYEDYSIEYYSPDIGFLVKIEYYDYNRELVYSLELVSYRYKGKSYDSSNQDSKSSDVAPFENTFLYLLILAIICILIIIGIVTIVKKHRKKKEVVLPEIKVNEPKVIQQIPIQQTPVQSTRVQPLIISCSGCKQALKTTSSVSPTTIKCPYCGIEGKVNGQ
ncbi:MAG: hypothetical protein JSV49_03055 [Thermoplasmata archaeon]|nr:MAG: hypothetical protein JSV49_03055 [Thermoplasmata archaeon]